MSLREGRRSEKEYPSWLILLLHQRIAKGHPTLEAPHLRMAMALGLDFFGKGDQGGGALGSTGSVTVSLRVCCVCPMRHSRRGLYGLKNLENTCITLCYLKAIMQFSF